MGVPQYHEPHQPLERARERLKICIGLSLGLIPAACAIIFYATLCPFGDKTCSVSANDTTTLIQAYLFVGAPISYLLQVVATVVCFFPRATRPIALGLLIMLFVGPLVALTGMGYVNALKLPRAWA
jgi:hypothetical protein